MTDYKDSDIAAAIREEFPKHNKTAYSLAKRTAETGVMLCPRAKEIAATFLKQKKKPENRKLRFRIYGRLPDELAERVTAKMERESLRMQDLLLKLLTEWVGAEA